MSMKISILFLLFALTIFFVNINYVNSININSCQTISAPGNYYLTNDINNAPPSCIWIHGSNILFDGQNYSINMGGGGGNAIYFNAVYTGGVNYYNNTIRNVISNGNIGSNGWIPSTDYNLIHNITVEYSNFSDATFLGTQNLIVRYNNFQHLNVHAAHDGPDNCATPQTFISPINSKIYGNTIVGAGEFNLFYGAGGCGVLPNTNSLIENNTIINTNPATSTSGGNIDVAAIEGGVSNLIFRNNKLYSMYGPFGMGIRDGIENNLFENNYFWVNYTGYAAVAILSGAPSQGFNQPNNNTFRNNTFVGGQAMGFMMQSQSTNNRFENNIFWGNAVAIVTPTYAGGNANYISNNPNNIFYHNTFISSNPAGSATQLVNGAGNPTTFNNNIFINTNSNRILNCDIFNPITNYIGNNNIFYGTSTGIYCSYTGISAWRTATGEDANSLETNPLFIGVNPNPGNNNINEVYKFKLQNTSPGCNLNGDYVGAYPCAGSGPTCSDSDSGNYPTINNATQGTAVSGSISLTDTCADSNTLTEYYCQTSTSTSILSQAIPCPNGCSNGTCLSTAIDVTPPTISNIRIINTTNSSAIINWTTNELASSLLKYGLTISYGSQSIGNSNAIEHSVTIINLQPNTQYYYVVNSSDASGNTAQSSQQTFMTLATVQQCTINCANYSLNLTVGLNFVSIPLVPSSNNINTLFSTIKPNMKAIFYYNSLSHNWEIYNANDSIPSDLLSIEPNKGYFIFMKNDSNLTIAGSLTNSTGDTPIKQLAPGSGWNALGIFGLNSKTIAQELQGINYTTFWKFNKTTNQYVQINSTSSLIYPGEAYWTYIN